MKKIILFAALAAFALTSCQQDITFEENKPEGLVFTATTEIPATKTALDASLNVIWQAGDQIGIISNSYPVIYETETGGSTKASFSFKELIEATTAPFSPPDLDRRVDSPALSGRGSRPSGRPSG